MISVLGVDVGGTKIAVGPVDRAGTQLAPPVVALSQTSDEESFLLGLEAVLRRALKEFERFEPGAIGLACAGTVDRARREVVSSPNLPLVSVALGPTLQEALGMPVVLENDADAALNKFIAIPQLPDQYKKMAEDEKKRGQAIKKAK